MELWNKIKGKFCDMERQYIISIIVPVYNSDKYLPQCLDSIMQQTYKNLDVILVDDGSTDNSALICDKYAAKDNRFRVIHKPNGGLVAARKTGIAFSEAKYVSFVDADDWVDEDMYAELCAYADKYDCDMVCSGLYRQFESHGVLNKNLIKSGFYDKESLEKNVYPYMLSNGSFFQMGVRPNLVGKLIRKDIVSKIQETVPEDVTNGEDVMITYPCLLESDSIYLTDEAWYYYRQHPESMSQKKAEGREKEAIRHLYYFLKRQFEKYSYSNTLMNQLKYYISHLLIQREPDVFDRENGQLKMFGNIGKNEQLAIYGAGRFGKQIYYYVNQNNRDVIWVDKSAEMYRRQGLPVCGIEDLISRRFDKVIIAVIDSKMSLEIANELHNYGIQKEKILSLDVKYITSDACLEGMGFCG